MASEGGRRGAPADPASPLRSSLDRTFASSGLTAAAPLRAFSAPHTTRGRPVAPGSAGPDCAACPAIALTATID